MPVQTATTLNAQVASWLAQVPGISLVPGADLDSLLALFDLNEPELDVIQWRQVAIRLGADLLLLTVLEPESDTGAVINVGVLHPRSYCGPRRRFGLADLVSHSLIGILDRERRAAEAIAWSQPPVRLSNGDEVSAARRRLYSGHLRNSGISGAVDLWVLVEPAGLVSQALVVGSSASSQLDAVAVEVARLMRFRHLGDVGGPGWCWVPKRLVFETQ